MDHGLIAGDAAFETLQVIDRVPFAMTRHIRRLHTTLAALAVSAPSEQLLRDAMSEVVAANELASGRVRLTVTAGLGPLGSGEPSGPTTVVAAAEPIVRHGSNAAVTVVWTRNERGALAGLKTTSYAENVRALRFAHERGAGEALFANTKGELCEGTGTNVFVVVDGEILTPPLSSGCLAGVTRELLVEIVDITETKLGIDVLETADEIFVTSSTRDVQGLDSVDGRDLDAPGPETARAANALAQLMARDLDP